MVMTERDRAILRQVYAFRLMTRDQIERLLFQPENGQTHLTKTSKVRARLKLLYHHGYLERIPAPIAPGVWAWRPVYRLSRKGAQLVAGEGGTGVSRLSYWGRGDDKVHRASGASLLFLHHALQINDVRTAITLAAQRQGYRVEKWISDWQLKSEERREYVSIVGRSGQYQQRAVIPDAYFVLNLGDRRAHFFLELDRATMSGQRWKEKVSAYLAYVRSGQYRERYQTTSLRILTVTTTAKRLENLLKATARAGGKDLFWFTTMDQIAMDTVLSSPIWLLASDERDSARKPLVS